MIVNKTAIHFPNINFMLSWFTNNEALGCSSCRKSVGLLWGGCSCKQCAVCSLSRLAHCGLCRKPICALHSSDEMVVVRNLKTNVCITCGHNRQLFHKAGDIDRLQQQQQQTCNKPLGDTFSSEKNIPSLESRFVQASAQLMETFNKQNLHSRNITVRVAYGTQRYQVTIISKPGDITWRSIEQQIINQITEKGELQDTYEISSDGSLVAHNKAKTHKNLKGEVAEVYQLFVDVPLFNETAPPETILASWTNHSQSGMLEKYSDSSLLQPIVETMVNHFSQLNSSLLVHSLGFSAVDEYEAWNFALTNLNLLRKTNLSNVKSMESFIQKQTAEIHARLQQKRPMIFPICWIQCYEQEGESKEAYETVWAFVHAEEGETFTVSIINMSPLCATLFSTAEGCHVNPLDKKYPLSMDDTSETTNLLQPGKIGNVNHIKYTNVTSSLILPIIAGFQVMQVAIKQRDPNGNCNSKLPSLMSLVSLSPLVYSKSAKIYNLEENLSEDLLNGRSFLDGQLLEGHSIHILEHILFCLQNDPQVRVEPDHSSVYPLTHNLSITKILSLVERFRFGKEIQSRIEISRLLFIVRSMKPKGSTIGEIICDAAQTIMYRAMKQNHVFGDHCNHQKELEGLKQLLDCILEDFQVQRVSLRDLLSCRTSCNYSLPLISCVAVPTKDQEQTKPFRYKNELIPLGETNSHTIRLKFINNDFSYEDFSKLWNEWFAQCRDAGTRYIHCRGIIQAMVDSIPEFDDPYWQTLPSSSWVNRWAIIFHGITQFVAGRFFRRLGNSLEKFESYQKRGMLPDEYWNLLKCSVLSLVLAELSDQKELYREKLNHFWMQLGRDHYFHMYDAQKNILVEKMIRYIRDDATVDSPSLDKYFALVLRRTTERIFAVCGGSLPPPFANHESQNQSNPLVLYTLLEKSPFSFEPNTVLMNQWLKQSFDMIAISLVPLIDQWYSQQFTNSTLSSTIEALRKQFEENGFPALSTNYICSNLPYLQQTERTHTILNELCTTESERKIQNRLRILEMNKKLNTILHCFAKIAVLILKGSAARLIVRFLKISGDYIDLFEAKITQLLNQIRTHGTNLEECSFKNTLASYVETITVRGVKLWFTEIIDSMNPSVSFSSISCKLPEDTHNFSQSTCANNYFAFISEQNNFVLPNIPYHVTPDGISSEICMKEPSLHGFFPTQDYSILSCIELSAACIYRMGETSKLNKAKAGFMTGLHAIKTIFRGTFKPNREFELFCYKLLFPMKYDLEQCVLPSIRFHSYLVSGMSHSVTFTGNVECFHPRSYYSFRILDHSHYSHGVQLSSQLRDYLLRFGIQGECGQYLDLFSSNLALLPSMNGEIDETQNLALDHMTPSWFTAKDYPFHHELRYKNRPRVLGFLDNEVWDLANSCTASTIIHVILGALSAERLLFFLSEPTLQWAVELILFRPGGLHYLVSHNPQFLQTLLCTFRFAIQLQQKNEQITNELYLLRLLHRIGDELRPHSDNESIALFLLQLQEDLFRYIDRTNELYHAITSQYHKNKVFVSKEKEETLQRHKFGIHYHFLLCISDEFGISFPINHKDASNFIITSILFRSETENLPGDKCNIYRVQQLREWIYSVIFSWQSEVMKNETLDQSLLSELLYPINNMYFGSTHAKQAQWTCSMYPRFECKQQNGEQSDTIIIDPALGFVTVNGKAKGFIRNEVTFHPSYKRFFGNQNFLCEVEKGHSFDSYYFTLECRSSGHLTRFCVVENLDSGDVSIYRSVVVEGECQWAQLVFDAFETISNVESLPGFLTSCLTWMYKGAIRISSSYLDIFSGQSHYGYLFFSPSQTNAASSSISYMVHVELQIEEKSMCVTTMQRYPSGEIIQYLPMSASPSVLSHFEHPRFIEYSHNRIRFVRFHLDFNYNEQEDHWTCDDIQGFALYERNSLNPFGDGSRYWLTLRSTKPGDNTYLLVATTRKLLPYDPSMATNNRRYYRCGNRRVWMDWEITNFPSKAQAYFLIHVDPEYPSMLDGSKSDQFCWLMGLYLSKRNYMQASSILPRALSSISLNAAQVEQIQNILQWPDYSYKASIIKLKILSRLARIDVNLFAKLPTKREDASQTLLGMSQQDWAHLFLIFNVKADCFSSVDISSLDLSGSQLNFSEASPFLNLSESEKSELFRALSLWTKGRSVLEITKNAYQKKITFNPSKIRNHFAIMEAMRSKISFVVDYNGLAAEIAQQIGKIPMEITGDRIIPLILGRHKRALLTHFRSIMQHLLALQVDIPKQRALLERWRFLFTCEPCNGDIVLRNTRILLAKVATAVLLGTAGSIHLPNEWDALHIHLLLCDIDGQSVAVSGLADLESLPSISNSGISITPLFDKLFSKSIVEDLPKEIQHLEASIEQHSNDSSTIDHDGPYYDMEFIRLPLLETIASTFLQRTEIPVSTTLWEERSDLLFDSKQYHQKHHKKSAAMLKEGFDNSWKTLRYEIEYSSPSASSELLQELYTCRRNLESVEKFLAKWLIQSLQRPGVFPGSAVCANQMIPISVLLNLWENNQISMLAQYGYQLDESLLKQLNTTLEEMSINICWRYHVDNILAKHKQIESTQNPAEKKFLMEHLYSLLHERICYNPRAMHPNNRKILALSRANHFLVRKKQVQISNVLLGNPNQAVQAALGLGKSSVIVPLVSDGFADGALCTWILCTQADKMDTIARAEHTSLVLNHPLLLFHFDGDSTPKEEASMIPSYSVHTLDALQNLYYDLLRVTTQKGIVITTRESLLYFVDMYEQTWIQRYAFVTANNLEKTEEYDNILEYYSKFFIFFQSKCRAILDEIDEILKANMKVNIALANTSKINRDTLHLAIECVKIILDPSITIPVHQGDQSMNIPISRAIHIMENCQAATNPQTKQIVCEKVAQEMGLKFFSLEPCSETFGAYMDYVLHRNTERVRWFYESFITPQHSVSGANYVRMRELLGNSFGTLFKRHNYSIGRMFTNGNPDDVGPYSAANCPIRNSHLSNEYDWAWALATDYAMMGITEQQCGRFLHRARVESSLSNEYSSKLESWLSDIDMTMFSDSDTLIPFLTKRMNDLGDWPFFYRQKLTKLKEMIQQQTNKELNATIRALCPLFFDDFDELTSSSLEYIDNVLFRTNSSLSSLLEWQQVMKQLDNDSQVGKDKENHLERLFRKGIESRLKFLSEFVNLNYYPQYIEGNACTLVQIFHSTCGFSGTMEIPRSLPQSIYNASDKEILRDPCIDGVVLTRFLRFALCPYFGSFQHDSTRYVDEAAKFSITQGKEYSEDQKSHEIIKNRTQRVLYGCYNALAIVDGGALLDVEPMSVIKELVGNDGNILECIQEAGKLSIQTIRWKDKKSNWVIVDLPTDPKNPRIILENQRSEKINLSRTLTFYDQLHSRGTDAKLAPDACMVNTVGDETRLTEWLQSEGRARQSGKGQTSRTLIANHIEHQMTGPGSLSFQFLRILICRSSNSQVTDTFYTHAEQIRTYLRDTFRFALSACFVHCNSLDRNLLCKYSQQLFIQSCSYDLEIYRTRLFHGEPCSFTDASDCLEILRVQQMELTKGLIHTVDRSSLSEKVKSVVKEILLDALRLLQAHRFPEDEFLPSGSMGVPKPGEHSSGIVLNTELAQEMEVEIEQEMETETDHEIDVDLHHTTHEDPISVRPHFIPWNDIQSPSCLWKALDSGAEPFIALSAYFPCLYKTAYISKNLGLEEGVKPEEIITEEHFRWLHDAQVEPFCYHIVVQHPNQSIRSVTVSRQEYSDFVFGAKESDTWGFLEDERCIVEGWRVSVYRHMGWGWVLADSTSMNNKPYVITTPIPHVKAELALLSGIVEIGDLDEQMNFLLHFACKDVEYAVDIIKNNVALYFADSPQSKFINEIQCAREYFRQGGASLDYFLGSKRLSAHFCKWIKAQKEETIRENLSKKLEECVVAEFYYRVKNPLLQEPWLLLIGECFGTNIKMISTALVQLKAIANRHRCGIIKKLSTAPMSLILHGLQKSLKELSK